MVELKKILNEDLVKIYTEKLSKEALISKMVKAISEKYSLEYEKTLSNILTREAHHSSGIGAGMAFPHARILNLAQIRLAVGIMKEPIDFDSLDNSPAQLIFLFFSPLKKGEEHLFFLSFATKFAKHEVMEKVQAVSKPADFTAIWNELVDSM